MKTEVVGSWAYCVLFQFYTNYRSKLTYTIAKGNKDDTWMHAWFRINTPFNTLAVDHNSNYARALRRIIVLDLNH